MNTSISSSTPAPATGAEHDGEDDGHDSLPDIVTVAAETRAEALAAARDLIMSDGRVVSGYLYPDEFGEREQSPAAWALGLSWGEYCVPDELLDELETVGTGGHSTADGSDGVAEAEEKGEEKGEEEAQEEAVYREVLESMEMEESVSEFDDDTVDDADEDLSGEGEREDSAIFKMGAKHPVAAAPALDLLPEPVLQLIFLFIVTKVDLDPAVQRFGNLRYLYHPQEALQLERVCKSMHRALRAEGGFWDLYGKKFRERFLNYSVNGHNLSLREYIFYKKGLCYVRRYKMNTENIILSVLGGESGREQLIHTSEENTNYSHDFIQLVERIVDKMIQPGSSRGGAFRLRGDTVGYLAAFIESWATERLMAALLMALPDKIVVERRDIAVLDRMMSSSVLGFSSNLRCSVALKKHPSAAESTCSCFCQSHHGCQWRWPDNDCISEDVLSAECRRKIARRLAYRAGIIKISAGAMELVAAEILHLLGVLVVDAFESSKDVDYSSILQNTKQVRYGFPGNGIDMFSIPPPPTPLTRRDGAKKVTSGNVYTIVPGQIKAAAKKRLQGSELALDGSTYSFWIPTFIVGEAKEREEEESRYYMNGVAMDYDSDSDETELDFEDDDIMSIKEDLENLALPPSLVLQHMQQPLAPWQQQQQQQEEQEEE